MQPIEYKLLKRRKKEVVNYEDKLHIKKLLKKRNKRKGIKSSSNAFKSSENQFNKTFLYNLTIYKPNNVAHRT